MTHKLVQLYPVGNDIYAHSLITVVMMWKGNYMVIFVRDADTRKIRMAYAN